MGPGVPFVQGWRLEAEIAAVVEHADAPDDEVAGVTHPDAIGRREDHQLGILADALRSGLFHDHVAEAAQVRVEGAQRLADVGDCQQRGQPELGMPEQQLHHPDTAVPCRPDDLRSDHVFHLPSPGSVPDAEGDSMDAFGAGA